MVGEHTGGLEIDVAVQRQGIVDDEGVQVASFAHLVGVKHHPTLVGLERVEEGLAFESRLLVANHQDG